MSSACKLAVFSRSFLRASCAIESSLRSLSISLSFSFSCFLSSFTPTPNWLVPDCGEEEDIVLALLLQLAVREAFMTEADDIAGIVLAEKDIFDLGGVPGGTVFFLVITMLLALLLLLPLPLLFDKRAEDDNEKEEDVDTATGVPVGCGGF